MKTFIQRVANIYGRIVHSNHFLRIISIVLGIIVWVSIINIVNPQKKVSVKVPIEINMEGSIPENYGLSLLRESDTLYATVTMKGSKANIFTFDSSEISASVNLAYVTEAGGYTLDVTAKSNYNDIEILNVEPKTVYLQFDKFITKSYDVSLDMNGEVASGYTLFKNYQIYPQTIDITGPQSVINKINRVYIPVNIAGRTESIKATSEIILENADKTLADRKFLSLSNEEVSYSLDIFFVKTLPLSVNAKNTISGDESSYTNIEITPSNITVYGNKQALDQMTEVMLEPSVELETVSGSEQSYVLGLPKNDNFTFDDPTLTANVKVTFKNDVSTATITLDEQTISKFAFINLPKGKTAKINTTSLKIPIRSSSAYIKTITASDVSGSIDFSKQNEQGQYLVNIDINKNVPFGITEKTYIDVTLS